MKTLTISILTLLVCATLQSQVKKIEYDFGKSTAKYLNGNDKEVKKFIENDQEVIDVIIKGYNPLRYHMNVNGLPTGLLYQNQPNNYTYFGTFQEPLDKSLLDQFKNFYDQMYLLDYTINKLRSEHILSEESLKMTLTPKIESIQGLGDDSSLACETLDCGPKMRQTLRRLSEKIENEKIKLQYDLEEANERKAELTKKKQDTKEVEKKIVDLNIQLSEYTNFIVKLPTYKNDIETMIATYEKLERLEFETKRSISVDDTDKIKISLVVSDIYMDKTYDTSIANLLIKKWLKIDFSTGLFWSTLNDESYVKNIHQVINPEDGEPMEKYSISKYDTGSNSYGAMAFINFHTQHPQLVNYGLSIGTGLLFNKDTKIVIAPTFSLFFDNSQRFIIHFGGAFSQVERIVSAYGDELFLDAAYEPQTKYKLEGKIMIGVSWNLGN